MTTPARLSMTDSPTYCYPGWPRLPHPGPKVLLGLQLRLGNYSFLRRKLRKEQKATGGRPRKATSQQKHDSFVCQCVHL